MDKGDRRVCDTCYEYVTGVSRHSAPPARQLRNPHRTILYGDFEYTTAGASIWVDLQDDHRLHIYGAKLDQLEDFAIDLTEFRDITLKEKTCTIVVNANDKTHKFTVRENHQVVVAENECSNQPVPGTMNKALFYAKMWFDAMQLARFKAVPAWYGRKRDSADSGISVVA